MSTCLGLLFLAVLVGCLGHAINGDDSWVGVVVGLGAGLLLLRLIMWMLESLRREPWRRRVDAETRLLDAQRAELQRAAGPLTLSPDGSAWWDGRRWVPCSRPPREALLSPDGSAWWTGAQWVSRAPSAEVQEPPWWRRFAQSARR